MNPEAYKMFSVEDKVIIITGGAGFLGKQYAEALTNAGAIVVLWDRPGSSFDDYFYFFSRIDITNERDVRKAVQTVVNTFGEIDVLINNAAMNPEAGSKESEQMFVPYEERSLESWKKEIEVNLIGMEICMRAVAPHMMKQRSGRIINVASEFANIAPDNRIYGEGKFKSSAYVASKGGVLALTRAWASYLGKYNICVNAFTPGGMPKPDVPEEFCKKLANLNMLSRVPRINEHNGAILFLCSDASSFMTSQQLIVDGGRSVL